MLLNSAPSAAKPSLRSTLIGEEKSPLPSRRAASRKPLCAPLERARSEHEEGNNQNHGDGATAAERASDRGQRGQDGDGHRRAARAGERLADGAVALAVDLAFPFAGSEEAFGDATVEARILVPSRTTTATPGEDSSRAYCAAVASETVTVIERLAAGSLTMTEPGAIAVRFPTLTIVLEPSLSVALASPACIASSANRTESALPCMDPIARASVSASLRAEAASLW